MELDQARSTDSLLGRVPLLAALPPDELAQLERSLPQVRYAAGVVLFREGEYGDHFYVVLDGGIAIIKALGTEDERLIAVRGAGEFVGEMSLFNRDGLRTASVRVEQDALVLELTRADFDALLHRHPLLAYELLRVMSARLGESHNTAIRDLHEKNERLAQAYADLQAAQAQIVEQKTLERELQLAKDIQVSMLPRRLATLPGVDIGARMEPARMVGGDFFDVIALPGERLGIVIGDASGKGVPAALFMALTCSLLRAEALRGGAPDEVLDAVNNHLYGMNDKGMFATVLYGVLDPAVRTFAFVRAGHELPLVWDRDGRLLEIPHGRGLPLGLFRCAILDSQTIELPSGAGLLLYTDGATDATDLQEQLWGLERLRAAVGDLRESSAQELCDRLVETLAAYQRDHAPADDITLVAIRLP